MKKQIYKIFKNFYQKKLCFNVWVSWNEIQLCIVYNTQKCLQSTSTTLSRSEMNSKFTFLQHRKRLVPSCSTAKLGLRNEITFCIFYSTFRKRLPAK